MGEHSKNIDCGSGGAKYGCSTQQPTDQVWLPGAKIERGISRLTEENMQSNKTEGREAMSKSECRLRGLQFHKAKLGYGNLKLPGASPGLALVRLSQVQKCCITFLFLAQQLLLLLVLGVEYAGAGSVRALQLATHALSSNKRSAPAQLFGYGNFRQQQSDIVVHASATERSARS